MIRETGVKTFVVFMEMTLDQNPTHKEGRPLEVAKLFVRNETKVGNLNQPVETLIHLRWRGNASLVVHTDDPNILDTAPDDINALQGEEKSEDHEG